MSAVLFQRLDKNTQRWVECSALFFRMERKHGKGDQVRALYTADLLERSLALLEQSECSTGYCCCGDVVTHSALSYGHTPVDEGAYTQAGLIGDLRKALAP